MITTVVYYFDVLYILQFTGMIRAIQMKFIQGIFKLNMRNVRLI